MELYFQLSLSSILPVALNLSFTPIREREDGSGLYELMQKLTFNGAVEGMTFAKDSDTFLVGSRSCHLLQCFDLISGSPVKVCCSWAGTSILQTVCVCSA